MGKSIFFAYSIKDNKIIITFKKSDYEKIFIRFNYFSYLLHSLKPNQNGEWIESKRSNSYIFGWPPTLKPKKL